MRLEELLEPAADERPRPAGPRLVLMAGPSPDGHHPEADQRYDTVRLFPKFFELPNDLSRRHVLYHELGHWYRQEFIELRDIMGWEEGEKFFNCFGVGNSEEGFAECFAVYCTGPQELIDRYPWCHDFIQDHLDAQPFDAWAWVDWTMLEIADHQSI